MDTKRSLKTLSHFFSLYWLSIAEFNKLAKELELKWNTPS